MKTNTVMVLVIFLALFTQAGAVNLTWDADTGTGGIQDGPGNWINGGTNWDNGGNVAWNNATPDTAIIGAGAGAAGTITLTGPITVDDITFNAASGGNYTVTADTVTLAGAGTPAITVNSNATIDSQLSGSLGFTKFGNSILALGGANNYTGTTLVSAGVLNIRNPTALGSSANGTTVNNGTALQVQNNITVTGETLLLRGQGLTGDGNSGSLRSISGNNTWTGNITADLASSVTSASPADVTRIASDSGNLLISGDISIGIGAGATAVSVGVQGNGTGEISGNITGGKAGVQTFFRSSAGTGMWTLSGTNTYLGYTALNGPITITGGAAIPNSSLVAINSTVAAVTFDASETIGSLISASGATAVNIALGSNTLTVGADNSTPTDPFANGAAGAYWGRLTGAGGKLTKIGSGTLTLGGSLANTYDGLTSVNAGRLNLNKTTGNAVGGDLTIQSGGSLSYGATNRSNQIADTSNVSMSGATSTFNFSPSTITGITETIASLDVSGGTFAAGGSSNWTVTGAVSFTGGAGNTRFVGNSSSQQTYNSLTLTGMSATTGEGNPSNSFLLAGNSAATQTRLTVGPGGLTLDGSNLFVRKGLTSGVLGSRLVLNGNVTTTGNSMSRISHDPDGIGLNFGTIAVQLSSTAPAVNRTFNIGGGGADLEVSVPITNGTSSAGGIIKTGLGTLLLNGANTYTGNTLVSAGTLGGLGTSTSDFVIAAGGMLSPGSSAGTLNTKNLTMQANSSLLIEIGGLTPGTQHDQVVSNGNVTLGGTLVVNLINGFTPLSSDTFTIMLANGFTGQFDSVVAPGAGGNFDVLYFNDMVQLTNFQFVPEPSSLSLLGAATLGLMGWRRRRARHS